jgi:hypothetical protein
MEFSTNCDCALTFGSSQDTGVNLNAMSNADLRGHMLWLYLNAIKIGSEKIDFLAGNIQ